jgi:hypothetical protein
LTGLPGFTFSLLRDQKTLSNIDPLPAENKDFIRRRIRFVPFFSMFFCGFQAEKSKGTKSR